MCNLIVIRAEPHNRILPYFIAGKGVHVYGGGRLSLADWQEYNGAGQLKSCFNGHTENTEYRFQYTERRKISWKPGIKVSIIK